MQRYWPLQKIERQGEVLLHWVSRVAGALSHGFRSWKRDGKQIAQSEGPRRLHRLPGGDADRDARRGQQHRLSGRRTRKDLGAAVSWRARPRIPWDWLEVEPSQSGGKRPGQWSRRVQRAGRWLALHLHA